MSRYILTMMVLIGSLSGLWNGAARAQETAATANKENAATNFLQRGWYAERGVELPRPFGIGVNAIFMERDISVTDVSVKVGNLPSQSIYDRFDFEVSNRTTLSMVRLDAWLLPFLDVYLMVGETRTDTSLSTTFNLHPPLGCHGRSGQQLR